MKGDVLECLVYVPAISIYITMIIILVSCIKLYFGCNYFDVIFKKKEEKTKEAYLIIRVSIQCLDANS